jgi:hypothetical protein
LIKKRGTRVVYGKETEPLNAGESDASGHEVAARYPQKAPAAPVIALRMEQLLVWVVERVAKFPREHKFTVGDRLIETCLNVMECLVEASLQREKHKLLALASRGLVRARILARLAHSVRCLSESQHLHFVKQSDEIGRMLGGWLRTAGRT